MPAIPTIPGSEMVHTPDAGVRLDFGRLNAPNEASANMGRALGDVGQAIGSVALKVQSAVNFGVAADADRQMRQAAADFQQSRVGRTDEDQWESEWTEKSNQVWQNIQDTMRLGPALRRQLGVNFKDWQGANAIEVKTMANRQRINRAVDRVGLAADEAAKDGDERGVVAAFDGAVEHQLMLPEQATKMKREYLAKIDEYAARNYIMHNPAGAVDFLEAKGKDGKPVNLKRLTPDDRQTLVNAARVQFTKYQSDNFQELIDELNQGVVRSDAIMQAMVDEGVISPRQRKSYTAAYRHGSFNTSIDDIGRMFSDLNEYDPQKDPQFRERATLLGRIATSGYPQNVQSEMNQLLQQKTDPKHVLNSAVAKDAFEGIDKRFTLGLYGKFETKVEDTVHGTIKTVVNPKVFESAMATKRRVEDATRKFLNDNPQATAEQVNDFVSNVQMTNVVRSGRQTILGVIAPTAAPAETAAERRARLDAILDRAKKK